MVSYGFIFRLKLKHFSGEYNFRRPESGMGNFVFLNRIGFIKQQERIILS